VELKASGVYIRSALIKVRKSLITKVALNPKSCSVFILDEVKTLSQEEIASLLSDVKKEYPLWVNALKPFLKGIMDSIGYASLDDMFEVDSKALYKADEKQFNDLLNLVYLVGLTIPDELAKGSRVETYFEEK
jgi:hypothetical protein